MPTQWQTPPPLQPSPWWHIITIRRRHRRLITSATASATGDTIPPSSPYVAAQSQHNHIYNHKHQRMRYQLPIHRRPVAMCQTVSSTRTSLTVAWCVTKGPHKHEKHDLKQASNWLHHDETLSIEIPRWMPLLGETWQRQTVPVRWRLNAFFQNDQVNEH